MEYETNAELVNMNLELKDGPDGFPVVDVNAELIQDVPDEIYASLF